MDSNKSTAEFDDSVTWSGLPAPSGWHIVDRRPDGLMWERLQGQRITVIEDITAKADGKRWLHVSVAKPNKKLPTYEDIQEAKRLFVGDHRECYQVFPPKERWVNFAHVLHLFCPIDQPEGVLPHFEGMIPAVVNGETSMVASI